MKNEVKELTPKFTNISPDDYLKFELTEDEKHEYYEGNVYAMGGANLFHNQILINLYVAMGKLLENKEPEFLGCQVQIGTPARNFYLYPDSSIAIQPEMESEQNNAVINPSVIFEIVSFPTIRLDKFVKFLGYRHIPSLQEYFLIDSQKLSVTALRKQQDDSWKFEDIRPNSELFIRTIDCYLSLDEIFDVT
jgi:Uma2 family endonuclease